MTNLVLFCHYLTVFIVMLRVFFPAPHSLVSHNYARLLPCANKLEAKTG